VDILIHLFDDPQLEVRELTSETLSGFFKISTSNIILDYIKLFKKWIQSSKKKRNGVLGYSSIIKAFPYEIPSFLPPILVEFASISNKEFNELSK
jgi:proteasome activator subunit 4